MTAPPADGSRPSRALLASVALISAAVLGFEVALTRVFAVLLWYHFAFLVISVALCGLGIGGYLAHWLRRRGALSLRALAAGFGLALDAALVGMLFGVFPHVPDAYWIAALLVLVPFAFAGAFLAEAFVRFPAWSGRLYAWDLVGAALAALGVVALLQCVGAIDACLAIAAVAAAAGLGVGPSRGGRRGPALAVVLALLALFGSNRAWRWLDIPPMPPQLDAKQLSLADRGVTPLLFTDLGTPGNTTRILDTRWNAFARTDVVAEAEFQNADVIYSNGNIPSIMIHWDGRRESIAPLVANFRLSGWSFDVAPLGGAGEPRGKVMSIGPGGGLDALIALQHGAARFDGAEINPAIVDLMREPAYRRKNGGLYDRPEVHVETAEGRAFAREAIAAGRSYDLVYLALIKTAAAGQGMAMVEAFIYTQDAFADYYRLLERDGQLVIVVDDITLLARFLLTGLAVLRDEGIAERDAMQHVVLMQDRAPGPYLFALLLQKSPIARAQADSMVAKATTRRLTPMWVPGRQDVRSTFPFADLADGKRTLEGFAEAIRSKSAQQFGQGFDIKPCPDDQPFALDLSVEIDPIFRQMAWVAALLGLGVAAFGFRGARRNPAGGAPRSEGAPLADAAFVLYFLALGAGFMLVEIPLTQKLILPLGYPTLALTVILFSILLGGGVGAWISQRFAGRALHRHAVLSAAAVALAAVIAAWKIDALSTAMLTMSLATRCALSMALLLPIGFLLGSPFPSGIRLFALRRGDLVPLMWGLNGVASVVGSLVAAISAKALGFRATLALGAGVYVVAALLLLAAGYLARSASSATSASAVPTARPSRGLST